MLSTCGSSRRPKSEKSIGLRGHGDGSISLRSMRGIAPPWRGLPAPLNKFPEGRLPVPTVPFRRSFCMPNLFRNALLSSGD